MKENNSTPAITPIPKEIPFQREVEYHGHVIDVATEQLSKFFGLNLEPPDLLIQLGSEGDPVAQGERIDGKYSVILRPNLLKNGQHTNPEGRTIHETAHCFEDTFLSLDPERGTMTPIYLSEGFAEWINVDDPANIRSQLNIPAQEGSYERIRRQVTDKTPFGLVLKEFLSIDKLYSTTLHEQTGDISFVPYWIGGSLVRYIIEKGGLEALKEIMRTVQVQSKYDPGWINSDATPAELEAEGKRVNALLKEAIKNQFGSVENFEKGWQAAVIGSNG